MIEVILVLQRKDIPGIKFPLWTTRTSSLIFPREDEKITYGGMDYYVTKVEWDLDRRTIWVTAKTQDRIEQEIEEMG